NIMLWKTPLVNLVTFQAKNQFHNGNACTKGWSRAVKAFDKYITANLKNPAALKSFK
ncbi:hypothetical protein HDU79_002592, partial [Rhizoclosmatium sp. JEL0117]